jgi:diketogulonate reductase-like aldo/keto reductase
LDIGVSNYSVEQMTELINATGEVPVVNQIEWSPFGYGQEMKDFCDLNGIVIQAYSPLTRGERLHDDVLEDIADKHEVTPALVLIRWPMQTGVVPIVKANHSEHLRDNLKVFDFKLDRDDMKRLASLNEDFSALGSKPHYMRA